MSPPGPADWLPESSAGTASTPPPSRRRRALRAAASALIMAGGLLVVEAAVTLTWEEPVTHVLAERDQAVLRRELRVLPASPPDLPSHAARRVPPVSRQRMAALARRLKQITTAGGALGELRLPRLGERLVVVKGTDASALRKGPGAYDGIGLPGVPGTAAIAGHRTTYGAPFRRLDRLRKRDRIVVAMPYATFTYRVERTRIVGPRDLSVLTPRSYDRLVLTACHPLYSDAQRLVVLARLERTEPANPF